MPDVNLSPLDAQQSAINRRRMLAQALQQMSMQPIQPPGIPGAKTSNWEGIAKLVQALSGSIGNAQADKQQAALSNQYQADRTAQAQGLTDTAIPQPQGNQLSLPVPQMQEAQIPGENAVLASPLLDISRTATLPVSEKQKTARERLVQILAGGLTSDDPTLKQLAMSQIQDIQRTGSEGEAFKREMAKQLASQQFTAQQAGMNRDLTRQDVQLGHQDRQAELAQALQLANRPKPFTANAGDVYGTVNPETGVMIQAGQVPGKSTSTTEYDQQLAAFNAQPELTKKYGSGPIGFMEYQQAQRIETASASKQNPVIGDFNKTGEDFLKTIPAQWRETVKKIANYDEDPTKVASMRGGMREQLSQWVNQVNPDYDASKFSNRAPTRQAFTTGTQGQQINAINTAIGHIDMLTGLADKLQGGGFVPGNQAWNAIRTAMGANEVTNFDTLKDALAGEVASVLSKGGATVSGIAEARDKIKAASSPSQLSGYVATLIPVMGSKLAALDYQYHQAMGANDSFSALSPESKSILAKHGISVPNSGNAPSGPLKLPDDLRQKLMSQ